MNESTWYRDGLVTLTIGSDLVDGVGTQFIDNVLIGGIFFTPTGLVEVSRVVSDTRLQLVQPYGGPTAAGVEYAVAPTQGAVVAATKQLQAFLVTLGPLKQAWEAGDLNPKGLALKGVKDSVADLPASGNTAGDGWLVDETLFVWTGTEWHDGGTIGVTPELQALRDDAVEAKDTAEAIAAQVGDLAGAAATATTQAGVAIGAAEVATVKALNVATVLTQTEGVRDTALSYKGIYASAAAGLVATSNQQGFGLPSLSGDGTVDLYINDAGAAHNTGLKFATKTTVDGKVNALVGKNLINPADPDVAVGWFPINTTGVLAANPIYTTTGFVPVVGGSSYTLSHRHYGAWYDASRAFISGFSDSAADRTVVAPGGAVYGRFSFNNAANPPNTRWEKAMLELGTAGSAYEKFGRFLDVSQVKDGTVSGSKLPLRAVGPDRTTFLTLGKNLFNKATITPATATTPAGDTITGATYYTSDLIAVTPGVTYSGRSATPPNVSPMRYVTFYDLGGGIVAGGNNADSTTFTPPAGVSYARITGYTADLATFQLEVGAAATAFEAFSYVLKDPNAPIKADLPDAAVISAKLAGEAVTSPKIAPAAVTFEKTSFFMAGKNLFNKGGVAAGTYMGANGVPVASATYALSDFIPVTPGVQYWGRGATNNMRFLAYFDASKAALGTGSNDNVNGFTPPAGVAFVRISVYTVDLDSFQLEVGAAATAFETFQWKLKHPTLAISVDLAAASVSSSALAAAAVTGAKIAEYAVTPGKTNFLQPTKNLFNKATVAVGYFMGANGVLQASAAYNVSDFIAVTAGTQYFGKDPTNTMRMFACFNAAKAVMAGGSDGNVSTFTPPAGCAYVRISVYAATQDAFQLEIGSAATGYVPFGYALRLQTGEAITTQATSVNRWTGKTLAFQGDSITAQNLWQPIVAAELGATTVNLGVPGSRLSGGAADAMWQDARVNLIPTTVDGLGLIPGTNDWAQNAPLGAIDSADTNTFNGAFNAWAAKVMARVPTKRVFIGTPTYGEIVDYVPRGWPNVYTNTLGLTTRDYAAALVAQAKRWGFPCADVSSNAGWNTLNIGNYMSNGGATDRLHPISAGGVRMAQVWIGVLKAFEPLS